MDRAARALHARWTEVLFFAAILGAIAFACGPAQLSPTPGVREFTALAHIPVPGGFVNAAGGNYFHERVDLDLDTRLGPFAIGAVYNSGWGWTWSFDATYKNGTLRDSTAAQMPLGALANGAAAPGTHWVKVDATSVKTKGGLLHEFDPTTGRLIALRWTSSAYPRLRFNQQQIGAFWRTSGVDQCTSATACAPVFTLSYDANARLVRIDDRANRTALFSYDSLGRLASARDGLDVVKNWPGERYEYAGAFVSAITNSEGERIELTSDAAGRTTQLRAIGAGDPTWRFTHGFPSATGIHSVTALDPLGHATTFAIDAAQRVQSITNPLGERTDFSWSGQRPASRTLPDGTRTTWTFTNDDPVSETLPSGNVRTFTYQADGVNREQPESRPIASAGDSIGAIETRTYDANGRLLSVANGVGETTTLRYAFDETVASTTQPDGAVLNFSGYGTHGHPSFATYDNANYATISYDAVGNVIARSTPDPLAGGVKLSSYDADRNLATIELFDRPAGAATSTLETLVFERRSDGQLLRALRPYGSATILSYDALGRSIAIAEQASPGATLQPGSESATTVQRDLLGRVTAMTRANGMREESEYDALGRIARRRTLRGAVLESEIEFEFVVGRLARAHGTGGFDEAYAYDAAGRLREVTHSLGEQTRLAYDERSRPTRSEFLMPGATPLATLLHAYDDADRELALNYLSANLVSRSFVAGKLERSLYGNGVLQRHYRDTKSGRATGRELWRGSKRIEKSDYALAAAPDGEIMQLRTEVDDASAVSGVTQEDFSYDSPYSGMGRRVASATLRVRSSQVSEQFEYDHLSNLMSSSGGYAAPQIAYNAEHNRVLSAVHPNPPYPFTTLASAYQYDESGFLTEESIGVGFVLSLNTFSWNARGQISAIHSAGALAASFSYDALGRRRERTLGGSTLRWRFGGLVEADANDQPVAIDLGEVRIQFDGQHRFRHADLRGNPKLVTDAAGRIAKHTEFSSYGSTGALGALVDGVGFADGTSIALGFSNYLLIGARLYAPALARFVSPDAVWNPINQYAYTLGNPVDFWDPSGTHAGSHHDLAQSQIVLAAKVVGAVGLGVVFVVATSPALVVVAGFAYAAAVLYVIDAAVEVDQQLLLHREQTQNERDSTREDRGGGGSGSVGGGGGYSGGGYSGGESRTFQTCIIDSFGSACSRTRSGWSQPPRFVLY